MGTVIHNVISRLTDPGWIGAYKVEKLGHRELTPEHIGRYIVYQDHSRRELGIITSYNPGLVFARYSMGGTAAGARYEDLWLVVGVP